MKNLKLNFLKVEELEEELIRISLKDTELLKKDYRFDDNKITILSENFAIFGFIPVYSTIKLFPNRHFAINYISSRHNPYIFINDVEVSFKETVFHYPFSGLIQDDLKNGITFKLKSKRQKKKLISMLETKFERLISTNLTCV